MCIPNQRLSRALIGSAAERNDAPVVTGRQRNVENPIDTSKATSRLKKKRSDERFKKGIEKLTARGRSPLDLKIM